MKKVFKLKGKLFQFPRPSVWGRGGWFFIDTGKKLTQEIKKEADMEPDEYKYVEMKYKIGKTSWKGRLHPRSKKGNFWIVVSGKIREQEGIDHGDMVKVEFTLV